MAAEKLGLTSDLRGRDGQDQKFAVERESERGSKIQVKPLPALSHFYQKLIPRIALIWLLVFDNLEDMKDSNPYLPTDYRTQTSILMTTQKPDCFPVTDLFHIIDVKSFGREDGSDLLFRYLRRGPIDEEEKESAQQISDLLDGLPLALATIGGYINQTVSDVPDFLESLRSSSKPWEASAI